MKKTSKLFGAMALSAILAMGAVPAFAEGTSVSTPSADFTQDSDKTQASGETNVHVATEISQLSVSVPLNLVVAADAEGGTFLNKPTDGTYCISNSSAVPVYVTAMTATAETDWGFKQSAITKGTAGTSGKKADIFMTLTPATYNTGSSKWTETGTAATITTADGKVVGFTPDSWKIDKQDGENPGKTALLINGSTSRISGLTGIISDKTDGTTDMKALKIAYTVSTTGGNTPVA